MKTKQMQDLLNVNCMDYAKYVITDRAIIDIRDGLKPIHRRIIWSFYNDGLLHNKNRTKSANACSSVLKYSPHGDSSVYQAAVRLANDSVNINLVDGKGSFGTVTSRDIQPGAMRYTEMRLSPITQELIKDIDKGIVDMVDNYDSSRKEPVVLPVGLPMALINPNLGIAVGLASNICGYDLKEVCQNAAKVMLKEEPFIMYPEFSTGEYIINNQDMFKQIHNIGRGTIRLRAKYKVENDSIVITNIPYTSTRESIIESVIDLVKSGTIKEVIDINDNSGIKGFDITIDIKKNTNIEMLMEKLYKLTPLENTFSANFTVLHKGKPKVLGVKDILKYWCEFRIETMQRTLDYNINKLNSELILMKGLSEILINLDECIKIIRNAESDEECIQSLMNKYNLNKIQAEYISNIKLRNLNKSSIQKQLLKIKNLEEKLKYSIELRNNENDIRRLLAEELISLGNKYSKPRKSELLDITDSNQIEDILIEDYNLNIVLSKEGYMKKVKLTSLRGASEYKFKDGDTLLSIRQTSNKNDLLVFTTKQNCYKLKIHEIQDDKPSVLGLYLPSH